MSGLFYTDYYIPKEYMTFEKILEADKDFLLPESCSSLEAYYDSFKKESGLDKIAIGQKEKGVEVFSQLLEDFFKQTGVDPASIAGLVYTDPVPFNSVVNGVVSIPHYLINKFNLENATVSIVQQQCTGFILSIALANGLLKEGQYLLVLSSNYVEELANRNFNYTFMGDGAALAVISKDNHQWKVVDLITSTSGINTYNRYHNYEDVKVVSMDVIKKGVGVIHKLLNRNNVAAKDLYTFIPQNINEFIYSNLYARLLGIKKEKIFSPNLSYGGHIGDVDLIRNFADFQSNNSIPDKSYILLYGLGTNGLDMSYGAVLLQFNK